MTYSIVPALRADAGLAAEWEPRLTSSHLRPGTTGRRSSKAGALAGMAMTEKQGGSDVRANTTAAEPVDGGYRPHRPQVVLLGADERPVPDARPSAAPACPASPCPAGCPTAQRNAIRIERLKDKLGNRSNASSEIELDGAWGTLLGDEGAGVATIIRMVNHTRLDCVIGVTGQMRAGLVPGDPPRPAPHRRSASCSSTSR